MFRLQGSPGIFKSPPRRTRLPDWEPRLFRWLSEMRSQPLAFGRFDCAIGLAAGAVLAQTGVDLADPHRGQYSDELEAHRYMRRMGWGSHTEMMDSLLTRARPGNRHRGNIVLLESDIGQGFAVRTGAKGTAFAVGGVTEFHIPRNVPEWSPL